MATSKLSLTRSQIFMESGDTAPVIGPCNNRPFPGGRFAAHALFLSNGLVSIPLNIPSARKRRFVIFGTVTSRGPHEPLLLLRVLLDQEQAQHPNAQTGGGAGHKCPERLQLVTRLHVHSGKLRYDPEVAVVGVTDDHRTGAYRDHRQRTPYVAVQSESGHERRH